MWKSLIFTRYRIHTQHLSPIPTLLRHTKASSLGPTERPLQKRLKELAENPKRNWAGLFLLLMFNSLSKDGVISKSSSSRRNCCRTMLIFYEFLWLKITYNSMASVILRMCIRLASHTSSSQHPDVQYLRWPLALEWQLPATAARKMGHEGWLLGTCERNIKKWIGAMSVRLLQLPCLLPSPFNQMKASHGPTFLDMWQNVMHKTSRQTKRYSLIYIQSTIWRLIKSFDNHIIFFTDHFSTCKGGFLRLNSEGLKPITNTQEQVQSLARSIFPKYEPRQ